MDKASSSVDFPTLFFPTIRFTLASLGIVSSWIFLKFLIYIDFIFYLHYTCLIYMDMQRNKLNPKIPSEYPKNGGKIHSCHLRSLLLETLKTYNSQPTRCKYHFYLNKDFMRGRRRLNNSSPSMAVFISLRKATTISCIATFVVISHLFYIYKFME